MNLNIDLKKTDTKSFVKRHGAKLLYFTAMLALVIDALIQTSMLTYSASFSTFFQILGILLITAKLIIYERKNNVQFLLSLLLIALAFFIKKQSFFTAPLYITLIAAGSSGISFKDIAKYYFYTASIFLGIVFTASLFGLVKNLEYFSPRGVRYSFGIVYPTDFAAHVFFIMASYAAAFEKKLNYYNCIGAIVVTVFVYVYCKTRVDCGCIILLWLGIAVIKFIESKKKLPGGKLYNTIKNLCRYICIWSMPAAAVIMVCLSKFYDPSNKFMAVLNNITSARLSLGKRGFDEYDVNFFGQVVPMRGNGVSEIPPDDYFFLDCSYIYMLLVCGLVFTLLFIAAYVLIGMRYEHNGVMLWTLAVIALNCMIAHHLPDCAYCIFTAALIAEGGIPLSEVFHCVKVTSKNQRLSS